MRPASALALLVALAAAAFLAASLWTVAVIATVLLAVCLRAPRGRPSLLSPLLASSLERGLNLAEAMEARGYGRPGRTSVPARPWRALDAAAVCLALAIVIATALWL